jgi:hypothetical protein
MYNEQRQQQYGNRRYPLAPNLRQQYNNPYSSEGYNRQTRYTEQPQGQQPSQTSQYSSQPQSNVKIQQRPNSSNNPESNERRVSFPGNVGIPTQMTQRPLSKSREVASLPAQCGKPRNDQRVAPYPSQASQNTRQQAQHPLVPLQAETRSQVQNNPTTSQMEVDSQETMQSGRAQPREPQRRNAQFQQVTGNREEAGVVTPQRKPHELPPPIIGIVGYDRFTPDTILEAPVTLKVRELMDIAPVVRRQIANSMKSSKPRNRTAKGL